MIDGGDGDDNLSGDAGIDTINGGDGDDHIDGGLDNNRLFGDAGNDTLISYMGHDILEGGAGSDILNSGFGNDTLRGGAGNDLLFAGGGIDELYGDAGSDLLVSEVFDQVVQGQDVINLEALRVIWNRNQSLATRRFVVLNGSDASFGHKISFGELVRIDGFSDSIFGGDGSDLILAENGQAKDVGAIDILELP